MKLLLSHPTGNKNVREVLSALIRSDQLTNFFTTIAADPNSSWLKLLPSNFQAEWLRRQFDVPKDKLKTHPFLELARIVLPKLGMSSAIEHEKGWASVDAVYQNHDLWVANSLSSIRRNDGVEAVYAYEDGALHTFRKAKSLGLQCIYDLPIAYWQSSRSLLQNEADRLPDWALTLGGGISDSAEKLDRKTEELQLADTVVCPSNFVADSLPSWAKDKHLIQSHFGSPSVDTFVGAERRFDKRKGPLRILFAGSMGQRKGLGDLFQAIQYFDPREVELVVMGSPLAPMEFYKKKLPHFRYEKGRPNDQVLSLMRSCDIFCLPSIVEGRALVMQEAMSQGLPIIITPNTGGDDLVIEEKTGFLVPVGSPESIANRIQWFLDHRLELADMSQFAKSHASQYTWHSYGERISQSLLSASSNLV